MIRNLVLFWAISTHTNRPSQAHLSHVLKRSASEVHSVNTCIVSSCLRQGSVYFSDYQTPLSTRSGLSSSPFCHHSIVVFIGSIQPNLFSIPCGSTCCSFQTASVYKGSLSGKIRYQNRSDQKCQWLPLWLPLSRTSTHGRHSAILK